METNTGRKKNEKKPIIEAMYMLTELLKNVKLNVIYFPGKTFGGSNIQKQTQFYERKKFESANELFIIHLFMITCKQYSE